MADVKVIKDPDGYEYEYRLDDSNSKNVEIEDMQLCLLEGKVNCCEDTVN